MPHKILVVEDHPDVRRLVRLTLEFEDCDVMEAASADEAQAILLHTVPDVALLDVHIHGECDGLQLCRALSRHPRLGDTRLLMLTALGETSDIEAACAAGAHGYLRKPFSPLQLIEVVRSHCPQPSAAGLAW